MELLRIEEIEKEGEYWDLEVENNHNFYANNILIHNSNGSVCYNGEKIWSQSKGNMLDFIDGKDNMGFDAFVMSNQKYFIDKLSGIMTPDQNIIEVCVYGEWAGKGIQKGVAISEVDKSFYMFGIKFLVEGETDYRWAEYPQTILGHIANTKQNIHSIFEYQTYELEIDFNNPKMSQNKMIEMMLEVENECPVAKAQGISGVGEGIVFSAFYKDTKHNFKVKGDKHANSKVKTLSPVDEIHEQKKIDFANYACPAWRLTQMYAETFDTLNGGKGDIKGTGKFLKAVVSDVMKEELLEMHERGLEPKEVNGMISKVARTWFMEELDREVGL